VTVFTWHESPVPAGMPVRQVHGWLADTTGRVLIQHRVHENKYLLPGGKTDLDDADWAATIVREAAEESQVRLNLATISYLGHQVAAGDPHQPGPYIQVRLFALIEAFLPAAPDPDNGHQYGRLMISFPRAAVFLSWGEPGREQASAAARAARDLGLPAGLTGDDSYA